MQLTQKKLAIFLVGAAVFFISCSLSSQSAQQTLTLAISGGVYGELEPCG
ncbi:MAG: hypothetical protein K9N46_05675 [Candidatus Marinimicrobia bacterium]|nr:hypothetical protein [Candidatus Neomarinimicrobiota bacterium]MCF7880210.1 hypothetical protein [Candidatus Neomarinimicrobiota bacterium]